MARKRSSVGIGAGRDRTTGPQLRVGWLFEEVVFVVELQLAGSASKAILFL